MKQLSGSYDLSLDLFANPRSSLLTFFTRAGLRVGGGRFPRSLAYHRRLVQGEKEATDRYFLRHLECIEGESHFSHPRVYLSDLEIEEGRRLLEDRGIGSRSIAILSGASQSSKEWPVSHYARLAAILLMGERYQPFFLGQPGKRDRLESIRDLSHSQVVILPELPFRKLAAVLSNVRALVSPDGAVCHLGLALGVPTLGLFGPTDPDVWFPYGDLEHAELSIRDADCRPCHLHECDRPFCMEDQSPEQVADSLSRLLERT
jgi:ADP-heptose:LPS heptosyltransferase